LHHYFSGEPIHVIAYGMHPIAMGSPLFSSANLGFLSLAWLCLSAGFLLAWILSGDRRAPLPWIAVAVAALILPSHLVWKPYFVLALPLAMLAASRARDWSGKVFLAAIFVVINFTGFDFVGASWGAHFEAASLFLWAELALIWFVVRQKASI
jgi:hypothetical protein